jgi:hypothetical protein
LEKSLGLNFKPFGQIQLWLKMWGQEFVLPMHNFAIFNIVTSQVDVAGYLGQLNLLNTPEKPRGLDFKPFGQNTTFGLKM